MAKLLSGTTVYGNATVNANLTVGGTTTVNQLYNGGTGALQVTGNTSIAGSTVSQNIYLGGGNNLLANSSNLISSQWASTSAMQSVTTGYADPFGGTTASFLVPNTSNTRHNIAQSVSTSTSLPTTFSLYAKAGNYTSVYISNAVDGYAIFDLTGVSSPYQGAGWYNLTQTYVGNGWYRLTGTSVNINWSSYTIYVNNNYANSFAIYSGDGTSGIYVAAPQLEYGNTASPYIATTTTAITQTNNLYIPTGNIIGSPTVTGNLSVGGNLIIAGNVTTVNYETVLYTETANVITANAITVSGNTLSQNVYLAGNNNLFTYSSNFTNSQWNAAGVTVTGSQSDPFGGTNASQLVFASQYSWLRALNYTLIAGVTYTLSIWCYVASGTRTFSVVDYNSTIFGSFTANTTWTRYSVTFTAVSNTTLAPIQDRNASGFVNTYIYGAQLELGSIASPYTPTTSTAITNTNNLYIPTDSAIGIGTTSPNAAIHIVQDGSTGPGSIPEIILDNPNASSSTTYAAALMMRIQGFGSYTQSGIIYDWYGNYYTPGTNITPGHGINYISGRPFQANHQFRNNANTTQAIITDASQSGINYGQLTNGIILTNQYLAGQNWLNGGYNTNLQVTGNTVANGVATIQNIVVQGQNNLFTYSNDFTQSVWQKANTVINSSLGLIVGPDNITYAQSVTANQSTGNGSIYRTTTVSNQNGYYTFSFYVAANTSGMTNVYATLGTGNNYSTNTTFSFPLSGTNPVTPTFVSQNGMVANTATAQRVGSYYRCVITGLLYDPTGSGIIRTDILVPTNATSNASVFVWGTQLEQGQQASNFTSTTTTPVSTNNNIYIPSGNVQSTNLVVSNKVNWVNSNNTSVIYQTYNSITNSLDTVFG